MLSNLVSSIHSTTFTEREDEDHNTVEYDCNKAPPFFEGHHFFLEPIARTCRISVKFDRNKEEITLTASLLRDLLEIFVFFEEHHISFLYDTVENLAVRKGRLVVARPWGLSRDLDGSALQTSQENTASFFRASRLAAKELDLLRRFELKVSPRRLLKHPTFWTVDRSKCFILDVAGSRVQLREKRTPRLRDSWVTFMEKSELKTALEQQNSYYSSKSKGKRRGGKAPFKEFDMLELSIFTSNLIRHFEENKGENTLKTSSDAFMVVEKEYELAFRA